MYTAPKFWLGNDASADHFAAALLQYQQIEAAGGFSAYRSTARSDLGLEPLLNVQENVGIVQISGSLVSGNAGFMAIFGSMGYDDIRESIVEAVLNPDVKTIMLHVKSGGGMVAGCEDFCAFLKTIATYKPITTYADGVMASAAYWIGSHGQHISTNQTSTLGSLGVLMVHTERTEMMAKEGVKTTVVRSGKYKALANPVEALTPEALAELQGQADVMYQVFLSAVSANRKVTYEQADTQMGQGREFLGKAAVESGLADALMSYDQALAYAKSLDKSKPNRNNLRNQTGAKAMKVTLNTAQLAALAAGATLSMLGVDATAEITNMPTAPAQADITVDALAALRADLNTAQAAAATSASLAAAAQASLTNAQAALGASEARVAALTTENTAALAQAEAMLSVVRGTVASMSTALGSAVETSALTAAEAVAKHTELAETFNKRFPGGRLSAPPQVDGTPATASAGLGYLNLIKSGPKAAK